MAGIQMVRVVSSCAVHWCLWGVCQGKVSVLGEQAPAKFIRPVKSSAPSGNDSAPSLTPPFIHMDSTGSIKNTQENQRGP